MTKIDIFSGFLGSGKTTLIKKLIKEAYSNEKVVLIENEFGEIGIDGAFLREAGIEITEMNSGCICCSLVGDFSVALGKVLDEFKPDRILIEPSGVGKLSDVIKAVENIARDDACLNSFTTVVDVNKCKMYMKNFGEFFNDQIEHAATIILSHVQKANDEKIQACIEALKEHNDEAIIVSTDWDQLDGDVILHAMEGKGGLKSAVHDLEHEHHHHHHHHEHDENCTCEHHHHHEHEHCHEHNHHEDCHDHECHHDHDHDDECNCGHHHEHKHEHGECCCGDEHHHDHHHHHADEVFSSWGVETARKYSAEQVSNILNKFTECDDYGIVLRAKGVLEGIDGKWIHFDYIPGEADVRLGNADITGKICVIGSKLDTNKISELFGI